MKQVCRITLGNLVGSSLGLSVSFRSLLRAASKSRACTGQTVVMNERVYDVGISRCEGELTFLLRFAICSLMMGKYEFIFPMGSMIVAR